MTALPEGGISFDQDLPQYDLTAFQPLPVSSSGRAGIGLGFSVDGPQALQPMWPPFRHQGSPCLVLYAAHTTWLYLGRRGS